MIRKIDRNGTRKARHECLRRSLKGTAERPRLNVYRSLSHTYAQLIDDGANGGQGGTIVSASTLDKEVAEKAAGLKKAEASRLVGKAIGEKAAKAGIEEAVFDRGGYKYAGRVAMVAEGAREAGLKF